MMIALLFLGIQIGWAAPVTQGRPEVYPPPLPVIIPSPSLAPSPPPAAPSPEAIPSVQASQSPAPSIWAAPSAEPAKADNPCSQTRSWVIHKKSGQSLKYTTVCDSPSTHDDYSLCADPKGDGGTPIDDPTNQGCKCCQSVTSTSN